MTVEDARDTLYFSENMDERSEIEGLPSRLQGVQTFVDVGASLEQYTLHADRIIRNGLLIAVEADPLWFSRLEANVRDWSSKSTNRIEAVHAAVSDDQRRINETRWMRADTGRALADAAQLASELVHRPSPPEGVAGQSACDFR